MKLYLTKVDGKYNASRGVYEAMEKLGTAVSMLEALAIVEDYLRTGDPVYIGETTDQKVMMSACDSLTDHKCELEVREAETPVNQQTAEPLTIQAYKLSLVIMAHCGGNPGTSLSLANGVARVTEGETAAIFQDAATVIVDTFVDEKFISLVLRDEEK